MIPPKKDRLVPRPHDKNLCADRNKIECCFGRFKQCRAFATRYDKTADSFLAVTHLVTALNWLR